MYSCLTQMPTPWRPLHQWPLQSLRTLLPSGPRSTLMLTSYVMRRWPTSSTVQWLCVYMVCRPVTYILRVWEWLWQLRLSRFLSVPPHKCCASGVTPFRAILVLPFATTQRPRHRHNFPFSTTPSPALQATQPSIQRVPGAARAWGWPLTSTYYPRKRVEPYLRHGVHK